MKRPEYITWNRERLNALDAAMQAAQRTGDLLLPGEVALCGVAYATLPRSIRFRAGVDIGLLPLERRVAAMHELIAALQIRALIE